MKRITALQKKIRELYEVKKPDRDDWADWLYEHHIFLVSTKARELVERFGAKAELAEAAGMLHDIADAVMSRFSSGHEQESTNIARTLLKECDFTEEEIGIIVDDAIRFHSCRNGELPATLEGQVMATADAVVHLTSDFYTHALAEKTKETQLEEIQQWALPKIERDYHTKLFFNEIKNEMSDDYQRAKLLFV